MKTFNLGSSDLTVPVLGLGCMRMGPLAIDQAAAVVAASVESGVTFFDHADIYDGGRSESVFAEALAAAGIARDDVILQTKCGIREGRYDFSRKHILASVEGSLKRLRTDRVEVLLLHRPDALVEPEEVAAAFDELHTAGKVLAFGVSNQNPAQIELLRRHVRQPLVANQLQLGLGHTTMIDQGLTVNMNVDGAVDRDGGILDYCRLHDITIQPWSPLQAGFFGGVILDHPDYSDLNIVLRRIADEQGVTPDAVAIAWLLRHPAGMQPILGTMTPGRITAQAYATDVSLSREDWYELYRAAGNKLP
jgi:predicted oxidoreductase